ncbi:MAG TPA: lysozyme inhibitor LprI family protein [Steroidobacteraceae bacterium]
MRFKMDFASIIAAVFILGPGWAMALSFDCAKASTPTELALCADTRLWGLDNDLGKAVKRELSRHPDKRALILAQEREWLSQRDRDCPAATLSAEPFHLCLIDAYKKRMAAFSPATPLELKQERAREFEKKTHLCKTIADAYRPLANAHPGQAPLEVLAKSADSPLKLASRFQTMQHPATDLGVWAAAQKQPFALSPDLQKELKQYGQIGDGVGTLVKALDVDFYTIGRMLGSMGCADDLSFVVRKGIAFPATNPEDSTEGACGSGASFATIAGFPAAIEQTYDWRPGMTASLDIWTWDGEGFTAACQVALKYKPRLTAKTLNDWGETCEGRDCDELRAASFKLAAAAEANVDALQKRSLDALTAKQKEQFAAMKEAFESQARDPSSDDAVSLPFMHHDQLYLASIGSYSIGWRVFADWSVTFSSWDDAKLTPRGSFSVGTWKGDLESVSIMEK